MTQGAVVEDRVLCLVINKLRRRVVVAFYLVAYHLHLLVYVGLRVGAVEHYVGEQIHGPCCVLMQNGGMIERVLLAREGVEVASHALQRVEDLNGLSVPLKVMCSTKWAMPSSPGSSSRVPAFTA